MSRKVRIAGGLIFAICVAAIALAPQSRHGVSALWQFSSGSRLAHAANPAPPAPLQWVAAAPGRVEPRSGFDRLSAALRGRVALVAVKPGEPVEKDQVLLRLQDAGMRARLAAAVAEAEASRHERDAHPITAGREAIAKAEDALFDAERGFASARLKLDKATAAGSAGVNAAQSLPTSRQQLAEATDRLAKARAALAAEQMKGETPAPSRLEAAVIAARAKATAAQQQFDETRIRAPEAGTVLQVNAKAGELVAPQADPPLVVMGDMTLLRVRTEVDERDLSKIKVGQEAVVRDDAYPGRDFHGTVTEIAPSVSAPLLGFRDVHRLPGVNVVRVLIDLEGSVPLLPGMQTDVFFKPYQGHQAGTAGS